MGIRLSVITVTLNASNHILQTLESIDQNKANDIEYIVVDGGSCDGTIEYLKEYGENINYWISEVDSGIYEAMNKGIEMARGEYIQFLNAGDTYVNDNILRSIIPELTGENLVVGHIKYGPSPKDAALYKSFYDQERNFHQFRHPATFFHRSVFERHGKYNETLKISSDTLFNVKHYHQLSYKIVDKEIVFMKNDGVSSKDSRQKRFENMYVFTLNSKVVWSMKYHFFKKWGLGLF